MSKNAFKSLGAVLAGLIAIIILSNGTDTLLETTGVFPPVAVQRQQGFDTVWMVMLALVYRGLYMGWWAGTLPRPWRRVGTCAMR
jgi:hypothetical protein